MSGASSSVLVCGGAGYIGSHMCKRLAAAGMVPVTFDNLSTGHREAVKWGPLVVGDLADRDALARVFDTHPVQAVLHFAARSLVAESVREPGLYFRNNVAGTLNLLDAMRAAGVRRLVFSSTAAVYGNPQYVPMDECHPLQPINPYGWSKLMAERLIAEYGRAHALEAVCLRYFNAAGADADGETGEAHEPETHLIPNLLRAALAPAEAALRIYGTDYPTPDGTCVRDYIHVEDLCEAHLLALAYLGRNPGVHCFNLGSGLGTSVRQVLSALQAEDRQRLRVEECPRRDGDPPVLLADGSLAARELGFRPDPSLDRILRSARAWHAAHRADPSASS